MSRRAIDHERLREISARFSATPPPRTLAEQDAYDRLEAEVIQAMGLTRAEFERMSATYAQLRRAS
jgi:RecG-like helicase